MAIKTSDSAQSALEVLRALLGLDARGRRRLLAKLERIERNGQGGGGVTMAHLFEVQQNGDPHSRCWDVLEYAASFDEATCTFRGDLSGAGGRDRTIRTLRRLYPGCKIRVERRQGRPAKGG
jgi:hypothetical protein